MESDKFKKELAYVLKKIKECSDYALEGRPIEYKIYTKVMSVGIGYPTTENEQKLLAKLIEWKAIELAEKEGADNEYQALIIPLHILRPKFDEIYDEYTSEKINNTDYFVNERELINKITTADRFKQAQSKWSIVKDIVDAIYAKFPPFEVRKFHKPSFSSEDEIELYNANTGYQVFLDPNTLSPEHQAYFQEVLHRLCRADKVISFTNYERVVITTKPIKEFLNGHILIHNRSKFEEYHQALSDFYNFIELTGKQRFPDIYKTLTTESKPTIPDSSNNTDNAHTLSNADKKKLFILEKLREEWDLAPKKDEELTMIQAGLPMYLRPAGKVSISPRKISAWQQGCDITDWDEFERILTIFKQEGLISNFSVHDEYE